MFTNYFVDSTTKRTWEVIVFEREGNFYIEFTDTTHNQFVSSYYLETFYYIPDGQGLLLYGGEPVVWSLNADTVNNIKDWIDNDLDILW